MPFDRELVNSLTSGVSGASQHGCKTFSEAYNIYSRAFEENRLKVIPNPGGIYDNLIDFNDVNEAGEFVDSKGCARRLSLEFL